MELLTGYMKVSEQIQFQKNTNDIFLYKIYKKNLFNYNNTYSTISSSHFLSKLPSCFHIFASAHVLTGYDLHLLI